MKVIRKLFLVFSFLIFGLFSASLIEAATYTKNYSNGTHYHSLVKGAHNYKFCTKSGKGCKTVTYRYDPDKPTCSFSTPSPNGWTKGSVSVKANCSDSLSGCRTSSQTKTFTSEGQSQTFSLTDNVGNTRTCSYQVTNIDKTAPNCSFSTPSPNGWTKGSVSVKANCSDSLSGCRTSSQTKTFTSEGQSQTFSLTDNVGNTRTCSYRVKNIDKTSPGCTASLSPSSTWTNGDIRASVRCDKTPGAYESPCRSVPSSKTISRYRQTQSFTVYDQAGNQKSCSTSSSKALIDKTKPRISNLNIHHLGTSIGIQSASTSASSPNQFRADDNQLRLYFTAVDAAADTNSGQSGLYFDGTNWTISISRNSGSAQAFTISKLLDSTYSVDQDVSQNFDSQEYFINLNQFTFSGELNPIFAKTGFYALTLKIFDKAGNDQVSEEFYIDIYPAEAYDGESSLSDFECDDGDGDGNANDPALANNSDTCTAKLTAKDEFGNLIFGREFQAYFAEQNTDGNYNLLADIFTPNDSAKNAFQNGLRFASDSSNSQITQADFSAPAGQHTQAFETAAGDVANPGNGITPDIKVSSLVPTLQIYDSNPIIHLNDEKAHLASEDFRSTEIVFVSPKIEDNGTESISQTVEIYFNPSFRFGRWVKSTISGDENILLDEQKTMNISASTKYDSKNLPTSFDIGLKGWAPESTEFDDLDLGDTGNISSGDLDGIPAIFTGVSGSTSGTDLKTHLRGIGDNVLTNLKTAFTSQIKIPISDLDENATEREVIYPGGNFGNTVGNQQQLEQEFDEEDLFEICPNNYCDSTGIEGFTIGANISGNILTSGTSAIQSDASTAVDLGGVEVKDIREETTANAYEIIRGMAPIPLEENQVVTENFLEEKDVFYYSGGTVKIGPLKGNYAFSGVKTLLIEDGNLLIAGDIEYESPTDSLGVILINSTTAEKPDTGNIFVNNDVSKFVGTYFADGSLTSTKKMGTYIADIPQMSDVIDRDAAGDENVLNKQLLLEGTLFTKNTLGGSYLEPMQNPWGDEGVVAEAQKYDLHFVRRYSPLLFDDGNDNNYSQDELVHCVNIIISETETECDPEGSSFLIRPDNRVQFFPPPGFRD